MKCKHGLLLKCCDECKEDALRIAAKVYKYFEDDGVYGLYILGEDLWEEFKDAFKNCV